MGISLSLIRQLDQVEPTLKPVLYSILEEIERQNKEREIRDDFYDLKAVVRELAEAQVRTEARLDSLTQRVEQLAEAQARTEARLNSLTEKVEQLAEAQARTEARLDSLTQRVEQLAEAQSRTEIQVRKLAQSHQDLQKQVGGLSDSVGYGIEVKLIPFIPDYARIEYGLDVQSVDRENVMYDDGRYDEVNILARGRINTEDGFLIGECKAKPGKKDADRFSAMLNRLSKVLKGRIFPVFIGYTFAPEVEQYFSTNYPEIKMVKTYAVEMMVRNS